MIKVTLIFIGAGLGGVLRYGANALSHAWLGASQPIGTMLVNISGCCAVGFIATAWHGPVPVRDEIRAAVLIGVLGGFTTFSAFGRETLEFVDQGQWGRAGGYVAGSVILSLLGVWIGAVIARQLFGTGAT